MTRFFSKGVTLTIFVVLSLLLSSCSVKKGTYSFTSVNIYRDTPVWELAKAVNKQNVQKIRRIAKREPDILDYQDPTYGTTLLFWAVPDREQFFGLSNVPNA